MKRSATNGSEVFNTRIVRTDEYLLLAKTMTQNGASVEQAALDIEAIDDMLGVMRMRSMINRKRHTATGRIRKDSALIDFIERRVEQLANDSRGITPPEPTAPQGTPGKYGFKMKGSVDLSAEVSPEELHDTARVYGFSKKQVESIKLKPAGFALSCGDWSMYKF